MHSARWTRGLSGLAACAAMACAAMASDSGAPKGDATSVGPGDLRNIPLTIDAQSIPTLRVVKGAAGNTGVFTARYDCPQVSTHTDASFTGGTYTAQGGFAESEIAAVSYTLPESMFPLKIVMIEGIFAQQATTEATTTEWAVWVWSGTPGSPNQPQDFPFRVASDPEIGLPHIQMPVGTHGTNVQFSINPGDPGQIIIPAEPPDADNVQTFSVGYEIVRHNSQTANPCFTAPPSTLNAFPVTDNTVIGCGTGYGQLHHPTENWLFAVNCGAGGCPPNGGWTRFSSLQADQNIFGFCLLGCRPRGDWMIRVTWDPENCPPPTGACCFGTAGCVQLDQSSCAGAGGSWRGPGASCGTNVGGQWSGCVTPPNNPPVANAGSDQTLTDTDNNGTEVVVVDGSASTDSDGFIASYRWSEGANVLQDGPAFLSTPLSVGTHTLTLRVTDDDGATDTDDVVITINAGNPCVADVDDGSGTGTPDGGVDISDLLYYLFLFDAGNIDADIDDGSGTGTPDGGVDISDLLYFLVRFDAGC